MNLSWLSDSFSSVLVPVFFVEVTAERIVFGFGFFVSRLSRKL